MRTFTVVCFQLKSAHRFRASVTSIPFILHYLVKFSFPRFSDAIHFTNSVNLTPRFAHFLSQKVVNTNSFSSKSNPANKPQNHTLGFFLTNPDPKILTPDVTAVD